MNEPRMFPIQSQRGAKPHPISIPWSVAELAYSVYSGMYGRGQSLERLAERGGFGPGEMDSFLPDWRERCDELVQLRGLVQSMKLLAPQIRDLLDLCLDELGEDKEDDTTYVRLCRWISNAGGSNDDNG